MDSQSKNQPRSPKPYQPKPLYAVSGYNSSLGRVQTISSQTSLPNNQSSSPEPDADSSSEQDSETGALKAYRYKDPQPEEPVTARPSYPERMKLPNPQMQRVDTQPNNAFAGPLQTQRQADVPSTMNGPANGPMNGSRFSPHNGSWGYGAPPPMYQRRGHRYGTVNIKGDARVIQGDAYEPNFPNPWLREHDYEEMNVEGKASLFVGDVPASVLPMFWGFEQPPKRQRREQRQQQQQQQREQPALPGQ